MKRITSLDNIKKLDYHYWIIIAIVIISYCVYLPKHFSIDSWNVPNMYMHFDQLQDGHFQAIWEEAKTTCFSSGRFTRGLIFLIFAITRNTCLLMQPGVNVIAILFMCLAGCRLWKIVNESLYAKGVDSEILFLCCLLSICNPFFTDWMQYIECQIYYPLALFLAIVAAEICMQSSSTKIVRWLCASALLVVSAGLYQIVLQFYVLVVILLLCRTKPAEKNITSVISRMIFAISIYAVSAIVQVLFTNIIFHSNRVHIYSVQDIIQALLRAQASLWAMVPYTKNSISVLFPLLSIVLAWRCAIHIFQQKKSRITKLVLSVIRILGLYFAIFIPFLISELWFPQRSMVGFWSIPLLLAYLDIELCMLQPTIKNNICGKNLVIVLATVVLFSNVYSCIRFGTDLYKVNAMDTARAQWLLNQISDYEKTSGCDITQIAFRQAEEPLYTYPGIVNSYENNQVAWSAEWNYTSILELVGKRSFAQCDYPEDRYQIVRKEYNNFIEDRISFEDDTAYVILR